ncbi:hypothetical protein [Streptomyces sp. SID8376]|uniref:hypothetical protein n=1 Tax=unclassified Streptomyces TaxID=2593676 RepID=UPI0003A87A85
MIAAAAPDDSRAGVRRQSARLGAVHRDRRPTGLRPEGLRPTGLRLAGLRPTGLRLAGATAWQVRRIAAAETGLACLAGSARRASTGRPGPSASGS